MKKISKLLYVLAAASLAFVSCQQEAEPYSPGDPEADGCYGVYFPAQEASGSHTYDPTADKSVTVTVARTNTKGAITVPVKVTQKPDVFTVGAITFADGQAETETTIRFDNLESGVDASVSVTIDGEQYASNYNDGAISFDFSVLCVEWKKFFGPTATEATATGHFYQICWGEDYDTIMYYYDTSYPNIRYCRLENGWHGNKSVEDAFFYWNTKTNYLYVPLQYMGYENGDGLPVYSSDAATFYNLYNGYGHVCPSDDWFSWAVTFQSNNGFFQPFYDGNGNFYLGDWTYICSGGVPTGRGYQFGGATEADADLYMAPGFVRTDYSIEAEPGYSKNGVLPVYFTCGIDTKSVSYVAVEGALTPTQIQKYVDALMAGEVGENIKTSISEDEDGNPIAVAAAGLEFEKTGVYTLVAVSCDAAGVPQKSADCELSYVAAGEEVPVVMTVGAGPASKYPGVDTKQAIEVWAYGENITDAKMAVFSKLDILSDFEKCIETLRGSDSASAEVLEAINGDGYVDVVNKLLPGTEYAFVVLATNSYEENIFISEFTKTDGKPLPIYQDFTEDDFMWESLPETSDGYFGKYNVYAVDAYGTLGLREFIGKVTVSDGTTADEEIKDEDGDYTKEYVTLEGLFPNDADYYGFDNSKVEISFIDGLMLFDTPAYYPGFKGGNGMKLVTTTEETVDTGSYYTGNIFGGGWVKDGYIAFVAPNAYASYHFYGIGALAYDWADTKYQTSLGWAFNYGKLLFVDETKDDNGIVPPAKKSTASIKPGVGVMKNMSGHSRYHFGEKEVAVNAHTNFVGVESKHEPAVASYKSVEVQYVAPAKNNEKPSIKDFKF